MIYCLCLVPSIRTIPCRQGFYDSAGSSSFSTYFSRNSLVQMVRCPEGCAAATVRNSYSYRQRHDYRSNNLYGNDVYTDFSSICRAAIHDGRITGEFFSIIIKALWFKMAFTSS